MTTSSEVAEACLATGADGVIQVDGLSSVDLESLIQNLRAAGIVVETIDFRTVPDKAALLERIGEAFLFPDYFGQNWDALVDCWSDMTWLPALGYAFIAHHTEAFAMAWSDDFEVFLECCNDVASRWSQGKDLRPFHAVIFTGNDL